MTEIDNLLTDSDTVALTVAATVIPGMPRVLLEADYLAVEATYPLKLHVLYSELYSYYNRIIVLYRHLAGLAGVVAIAALDYSSAYSMNKGITAIQTSCTAMEGDFAGFAGLLNSETGHSADHLAATGTKFCELISSANLLAVRLRTAINAI